jgi:hypothetical protein
MQPFVIVVVNVADVALRVGHVDKNGPLTDFENLRFKARPEAFGLRNVIAVIAAALASHGRVQFRLTSGSDG